MSLTIKDRLKALIRVVRIISNPKVDYINLMWQANSKKQPVDTPVYDHCEKKAIYTHTFFVDEMLNGEIKPEFPMLTYMAHVAAKSNNLEELNVRCAFYLNKVAVAHMRIHAMKDFKLEYIAKPIIAVPLIDQDVDGTS